jgi:hypothetical protein
VAVNLDRGGDMSTLEIEIELPGPQAMRLETRTASAVAR